MPHSYGLELDGTRPFGADEPTVKAAKHVAINMNCCDQHEEEEDGNEGPEHGLWLADGDPGAENAVVIARGPGGVKASRPVMPAWTWRASNCIGRVFRLGAFLTLATTRAYTATRGSP
jgi:hypothetical protein